MTLSQAKKLRRDICRTTDHIWKPASGNYATRGWVGQRCSRCKKREVNSEWSLVDVGTFPNVVHINLGTHYNPPKEL